MLPSRDVGLIYPSTFKVASLMEIGRCFCLAVQVFVNIYQGLREISTTIDFSTYMSSFPSHYIYGLVVERFETYFISNR